MAVHATDIPLDLFCRTSRATSPCSGALCNHSVLFEGLLPVRACNSAGHLLLCTFSQYRITNLLTEGHEAVLQKHTCMRTSVVFIAIKRAPAAMHHVHCTVSGVMDLR